MIIPDKVKIAGVFYDIKYKKGLNNGTSLCFGYVDNDKAFIELEPDIQNAQRMKQTLLHEIIHALDFSLGIKLSESAVDKIANGFYMVLTDNKEMFLGEDE